MEKIEDYPLILKADDISKIMRVSKPTAYEIMKRKGFPLVKEGRTMRVGRDAFFNWLNLDRKEA